MPFSFGSAGGNPITAPVYTPSAGGPAAQTATNTGLQAQNPMPPVQVCAAGDSRFAVTIEYNLYVCDFCFKNIKFKENQIGSGNIVNPLNFIITNNATNLRGI